MFFTSAQDNQIKIISQQELYILIKHIISLFIIGQQKLSFMLKGFLGVWTRRSVEPSPYCITVLFYAFSNVKMDTIMVYFSPHSLAFLKCAHCILYSIVSTIFFCSSHSKKNDYIVFIHQTVCCGLTHIHWIERYLKRLHILVCTHIERQRYINPLLENTPSDNNL